MKTTHRRRNLMDQVYWSMNVQFRRDPNLRWCVYGIIAVVIVFLAVLRFAPLPDAALR